MTEPKVFSKNISEYRIKNTVFNSGTKALQRISAILMCFSFSNLNAKEPIKPATALLVNTVKRVPPSEMSKNAIVEGAKRIKAPLIAPNKRAYTGPKNIPPKAIGIQDKLIEIDPICT